jgi:hypothetical protein
MLISQTIALMGHGMYDYPIIAPQVGLMFMLSVIIIHTQYERRCLSRPEWSEPEKAEEEKQLSYPAASSFLLYMRKQIPPSIDHHSTSDEITDKKRA